ncbi:NAD(P)-dependent alcohol dehydrogenase [Aquipuribacter sp. SD81]|uniref:NAD(P)-dependent alcohol dehydrogenase n=1 Tax=Aquipuribacter sp. SD81 TaxID=3127703 RepID=UPI003015E89C
MRAVLHDRYGPVDLLRLGEVPEPEPSPDEVLVRVAATSVHVDVWHTVTGLPYALRLMGNGVRAPRRRVPGTDVAGTVEAVGEAVTRFRPGQRVWGETVRGIQWRNGGAWAELVAAPEDGLVACDDALDDTAAAALGTPAVLAYDVLVDQARFRAGDSVLVNGAAGALGGYVVQLARALGASRVVGVDAGDRLDLVRAAGADVTVDYRAEDVTRRLERYDVVVDVASTRPFREWRPVVADGGRYIRVGHDHYGRGMNRITGSMGPILGLLAASLVVPELPRPGRTTPRRERLDRLAALVAEGRLRPVVDRTYPLADVVPAMQRLQEGRARGRIVLVP